MFFRLFVIFVIFVIFGSCCPPPECPPGETVIVLGRPDHYRLCDQDGYWTDGGVAP